MDPAFSSSLGKKVLLPALKILQKTFQNLRYRICQGYAKVYTLVLINRYILLSSSGSSSNIQQYVFFFSVFTLSHNVFIVLLMNIFYHFTFYFPLCFLLLSLLFLSFLISSFFYKWFTFLVPFSNCFPQTTLYFCICFIKRGLKM